MKLRTKLVIVFLAVVILTVFLYSSCNAHFCL